jgi:hypothetical protein
MLLLLPGRDEHVLQNHIVSMVSLQHVICYSTSHNSGGGSSSTL